MPSGCLSLPVFLTQTKLSTLSVKLKYERRRRRRRRCFALEIRELEDSVKSTRCPCLLRATPTEVMWVTETGPGSGTTPSLPKASHTVVF